jgi:putative lipoprotein
VKQLAATALAISCVLLASTAFASDADPWFGQDKALHFGFSVGLAAGGYAFSSIWLNTRNERALAGSAFSLTLGAGKELWDLSGHGDPSWRDFTWDVIGTAVGVALAAGVDALTTRPKHEPAGASTQGLLFHF